MIITGRAIRNGYLIHASFQFPILPNYFAKTQIIRTSFANISSNKYHLTCSLRVNKHLRNITHENLHCQYRLSKFIQYLYGVEKCFEYIRRLVHHYMPRSFWIAIADHMYRFLGRCQRRYVKEAEVCQMLNRNTL